MRPFFFGVGSSYYESYSDFYDPPLVDHRDVTDLKILHFLTFTSDWSPLYLDYDVSDLPLLD